MQNALVRVVFGAWMGLVRPIVRADLKGAATFPPRNVRVDNWIECAEVSCVARWGG